MHIVIQRFEKGEKQTLGKMFVNGVMYRTLELGWHGNEQKVSCIPNGTYEVIKRNSPKYGDHFHVLNVPNRDYILIHHGNYHTDILGCILVGIGHADINGDGLRDVINSKVAMAQLNRALPDKFKLTIE
jgi:hypothetical protein